jgi:hypothetical protein
MRAQLAPPHVEHGASSPPPGTGHDKQQAPAAHKLSLSVLASAKSAMALVGCPDRRIDRLCITCCSPSQPSHHAGLTAPTSVALTCPVEEPSTASLADSYAAANDVHGLQ